MKRGVSLLEVMFSILIVSVGLLGAVSVFTVAGSRMKRAADTDTVAFAARSAVHVFDTMGMRRPTSWYRWDVNNSQFLPATISPRVCYCIDSRFLVANTANAAA